jgi:hypothetical protein
MKVVARDGSVCNANRWANFEERTCCIRDKEQVERAYTRCSGDNIVVCVFLYEFKNALMIIFGDNWLPRNLFH